MPPDTFKPGDIVQLVVGGVKMAVASATPPDANGPTYRCVWFDAQRHVQVETFPGAILKASSVNAED